MGIGRNYNWSEFFIFVIILCWFKGGADVSPQCFEHNPGFKNGCAVAIFLNFPFKDRFKSACQRHNICNNCGVKFKKSRKYCDDLFREDMKDQCGKIPESRTVKRSVCRLAVGVYYSASRVGGVLLYKDTPISECNALWVSTCFL